MKLHKLEHNVNRKCPKCNSRLPSCEKICERHQHRTGIAQRTCDLCDRQFFSLRLLYNHIDDCHNRKLKYQCSACSMRFKKEDHLRKHIRGVKLCSVNADPTITSSRWMAIEWVRHTCSEVPGETLSNE